MRIGVGFGLLPMWHTSAQLRSAALAVESHGFDSLWLSDHVAGAATDPLTTLAYVAALTDRIKLGTSVLVLPGRPPLVTAKALATLDRLADGRLLPVFGAGTAEEREHEAFGVERFARGQLLETGLKTIRSAFEPSSEAVMGLGAVRRLDLWIGGRSDSEVRRAGRIADGWLGHFLGVDATGRAIDLINEEALKHDRQIDPGHFGIYLLFARERVPEMIGRIVAGHGPGTSDVPIGSAWLMELLHEYAGKGVSKFVLVPAEPPSDWGDEMSWLREAVSIFDERTSVAQRNGDRGA